MIDGVRAGIQFFNGGRIDNDGLITGDAVAIATGAGSIANTGFLLNNSGTLSSEGANFGFGDDDTATLQIFAGLQAVDVNNSGIIESPNFTISSFSGATINNMVGGQILSDTDSSLDDAVAFRGSVLEDFLVEGFQRTAFVAVSYTHLTLPTIYSV